MQPFLVHEHKLLVQVRYLIGEKEPLHSGQQWEAQKQISHQESLRTPPFR